MPRALIALAVLCTADLAAAQAVQNTFSRLDDGRDIQVLLGLRMRLQPLDSSTHEQRAAAAAPLIAHSANERVTIVTALLALDVWTAAERRSLVADPLPTLQAKLATKPGLADIDGLLAGTAAATRLSPKVEQALVHSAMATHTR